MVYVSTAVDMVSEIVLLYNFCFMTNLCSFWSLIDVLTMNELSLYGNEESVHSSKLLLSCSIKKKKVKKVNK